MEVFQSLTGSIHTGKCENTFWGCNAVSIPHRFNSHLFGINQTIIILIRFNPSQVQFTLIFS